MSEPTITSSAAGSLEHLDPHAVEIGENVRDTVDLSKDFLAACASTACWCR